MLRNFLKYDNTKAEMKEFLDRHAMRRRFSPDLHVLEERDFQLFFITDEMKRKEHKHSIMNAGSAFLATAYTKSEYQFIQRSVEVEKPIAIAFEDKRTHAEKQGPIMDFAEYLRSYPYGKLRGELHAVRPYQINALDKYKQNTVEFIRKRTTVVVPYQEEFEQRCRDTGEKLTFITGQQVYLIQAWMYVGVPDFWEPMLDAGFVFSAVKQFKSGKKWIKNPYYEFKCPK